MDITYVVYKALHLAIQKLGQDLRASLGVYDRHFRFKGLTLEMRADSRWAGPPLGLPWRSAMLDCNTEHMCYYHGFLRAVRTAQRRSF
jgi:hypothetical protein